MQIFTLYPSTLLSVRVSQNVEAKVLNLGPKFVPPAPEQVLERLAKEIEHMKQKVSAAWRKNDKNYWKRATHSEKIL